MQEVLVWLNKPQVWLWWGEGVGGKSVTHVVRSDRLVWVGTVLQVLTTYGEPPCRLEQEHAAAHTPELKLDGSTKCVVWSVVRESKPRFN